MQEIGQRINIKFLELYSLEYCSLTENINYTWFDTIYQANFFRGGHK